MNSRTYSSILNAICIIYIIFFAFSATALGINVQCSSSNGANSVSFNVQENLALPSSSNMEISLGSGTLQTAGGMSLSGDNSVQQSISGSSSTAGPSSSYSISSSITSSGSLGASISAAGTGSSGGQSQQIAGEGNVLFTTSGNQGTGRSDQQAGVAYGEIASLQSVSTGDAVSSSQITTMRGAAGKILSGTTSQDNAMVVSGSFLGSNSLDADLQTTSDATKGKASVNGEVSLNGGLSIDESTLQQVREGSVGRSVGGLRALPGDSLGLVNLNAMSTQSTEGMNGEASASPQTPTGYNLMINNGDYGSLPIKWTNYNPQIPLYLVGNSIPQNLNKNDVKSAISEAARSWDDVVTQKLFNVFQDGSRVSIDNSKQVIAEDPQKPLGYNSIGWRALSPKENPDGSYISYTYDWYDPSRDVNGYYPITESDVVFNNGDLWSTTGATGTFDVQTQALRGLGRTLGLDNVNDENQVMNRYYTGKRSLGSGDIAGIEELYGKIPIYRMWNPTILDHYYTSSYDEYSKTAVDRGYQQEGIMGYMFDYARSGTTPMYSMYSPAQTDHFYTTSNDEYSTTAVNYGYQQEGILGYIYSNSQPGTTPIYRMWSPAQTDHFYTSSYDEYSTTAVNCGYKSEGILGYGSS